MLWVVSVDALAAVRRDPARTFFLGRTALSKSSYSYRQGATQRAATVTGWVLQPGAKQGFCSRQQHSLTL